MHLTRVYQMMALFSLVSFIALGGDALASDHFPESAFGKAPAPIDIGEGRSYVTRAVSDWDERSDSYDPPTWGKVNYARAQRQPAGLVMGAEANSASYSVRHTPQTPAGQRPSTDPMPEAGAPVTGAVRRNGVQEVAVIASDLGFFPKTLFVTRDIPVTLFVTGASKNTLCLMMDSFGVRRQVRVKQVEEISFTPGMPGQYRFYCPVNGMEGTLVVRDLSTRSQELAETDAAPSAGPSESVQTDSGGTYRSRAPSSERVLLPVATGTQATVGAPKNLLAE